ncbi:hypothetical protein AAMO2058_000303500 [Amorphochlora amoebiformis]
MVRPKRVQNPSIPEPTEFMGSGGIKEVSDYRTKVINQTDRCQNRTTTPLHYQSSLPRTCDRCTEGYEPHLVTDFEASRPTKVKLLKDEDWVVYQDSVKDGGATSLGRVLGFTRQDRFRLGEAFQNWGRRFEIGAC